MDEMRGHREAIEALAGGSEPMAKAVRAPHVPSGQIGRMDAHLSREDHDAHEALSYHPHVPTHIRMEFERHHRSITEDDHHGISQMNKRRHIRAYNRSVNIMRAYARGPEHGQREEGRDMRQPLRYRRGRTQ